MAVTGVIKPMAGVFCHPNLFILRRGGGCVRSRKPLKYGDFVPERSRVLCFEFFLKFAPNSCPGQRVWSIPANGPHNNSIRFPTPSSELVDMASPDAVAVVQVAIAAAEFNAPRRLLVVEMTSVPKLIVQLNKSI